MQADGMSFKVYHLADNSVTVSVSVNEKKHSFNISADKKKSNHRPHT